MLFGKKIIAVCLAGIHDETNIKLISRLNEALVPQEYRLLVFNIGTDLNWNKENEDSEILVFDLIDYDTTDTIIILDEQIKDRHLSERIISKAKKKNVQVIVIDGNYEGCVNIRFDYRAGFEMLVRHVMEEHAPETVHFIAGFRGNSFSEQRIEVFKNIIEAYGIRFDESMVSYGDFWAMPAIKATKKLIDEERVPRAIICANDIMAISVIGMLEKNGYKVPDDVIVTGFDGIEAVHLTKPEITTCYCNHSILIDKAIESILNGESDKDCFVVPELLILESCGCNNTQKNNIFDNPEILNGRFYKYQEDARILMQMAESMQGYESVEDVSENMRNRVMKHTCIILNNWCKESSINPICRSHSGIDDDMFMFFESRDGLPHDIYDFSRQDYVPALEKLFERKAPIIFTELDYMNVPLGYVCFFYKCCDSIYYKKIPQIVSALNNGIGGWMNQRHQRYLTNRVEHIYEHDALTGLYNRLGFGKRLEKIIDELRGDPLTVIMTDLDGLKQINDNYGHVAGDMAIHTVANALKESCPENALCVRFGGDEMLAVIKGECDAQQIRAKFQQYLLDYNSRHEVPYKVSSSMGILQIRDKEIDDFDTIFKMADKLMYEEKNNKKMSEVL